MLKKLQMTFGINYFAEDFLISHDTWGFYSRGNSCQSICEGTSKVPGKVHKLREGVVATGASARYIIAIDSN